MFSSLVAGAREPWHGAHLPVLHSQEQEIEYHHPQSKRPQQRKRTGYRFVRKGGRREGSDYSLPLSCSHCFCVQLTELVLCPDPTQLTRGKGIWCHKSKSLGLRTY